MSWDAVAYQFLLDGDYQKLGEFYEQAIEDEADNINHYWYLSLVYLLQERLEEAQSIWFSIFTQVEEEHLEPMTEELIKIFDTEATRQKQQKNYSLAYLIRLNIQEIQPELVNNLLNIIQLKIILKSFQPIFLPECQIIQLLQKKIYKYELDQNLLRETLRQALNFPNIYSIQLAEASLLNLNDLSTAIEIILDIAGKLTLVTQKDSFYAVDLLKICYKHQPNNMRIIKELFWLYYYLRDFSSAQDVAQEFDDKAKSFAEKIWATYQLISLHLNRSNWLKIQSLAIIHKNLIREMLLKQPEIKEPYIRESFILVGKPLLYLEDNPQENRPLQNQISQLFQKSLAKSTHTSIDISIKQKLRIGYIGHTLRSHSVGWLSRWLLQYHNLEAFEIALYLVHQREDRLTEEWFKPKANIFYNFPNNPAVIIEQIKQDKVDILIDLDSLTFNLTCQVLANKVAPIQATWLGLDATGLPAIDYFIADPYVLPENAQSYYQEKIWRLPTTYLGLDGFEVGVPDRRREDLNIEPEAIIYLIVQGAPKRHPDNIRLQMRIIKAVNHSYLLIKGNADEEITVRLYTTIAQQEGVSPSRLRFLPFDKTEETHRANLAIADVVLDTYPYNGATTTLEVLWMGIPLVTRVGEQFAARNSYTFMVNAGLSEGIAYTDEQYVEWGVRLGTDSLLREQVIAKLRESRKISPLWNAKQFTQDMENAYQQMWAIYQHKH